MRIAVALISLVAVSNLSAQQISQDDMERCAAISDSLERLSCFERLTEQGRTTETVVPERTTQDDVPTTAVTADAPARATTPALETESAIPTAPRATNNSAASLPQTTSQLEDVQPEIGREQLPDDGRNADDEPPLFIATVREVTRGGRDQLYFHLENGQVWRQIESRYVSYPRNRPFDVEIGQGLMGDYRLRVEGRGRMVRIRRIE